MPIFDGDPWQARQLMVLRMLQCGFQQKQIAARLGISNSRVWQIVQRGRLLVLREREINHAAVAALEVMDWCREIRPRERHAIAALELLAGIKET